MFNVTYTPIIVIFENENDEIHCPKTMSQTCLKLPAVGGTSSGFITKPWYWVIFNLFSMVTQACLCQSHRRYSSRTRRLDSGSQTSCGRCSCQWASSRWAWSRMRHPHWSRKLHGGLWLAHGSPLRRGAARAAWAGPGCWTGWLCC